MCKAVWHALAIGSQDLDHDLVALPSSISHSTTYIVHTVVVISTICSQRRVDDKLNSNSVSDACLAIIDMCALAQNWHWCFLIGICVAYVDAQNVVMILWICMFWAICIGNLVYSVTCVNAQLQIFHWGRRNLFWNFSIDAMKVENSVIFNVCDQIT